MHQSSYFNIKPLFSVFSNQCLTHFVCFSSLKMNPYSIHPIVSWSVSDNVRHVSVIWFSCAGRSSSGRRRKSSKCTTRRSSYSSKKICFLRKKNTFVVRRRYSSCTKRRSSRCTGRRSSSSRGRRSCNSLWRKAVATAYVSWYEQKTFGGTSL